MAVRLRDVAERAGVSVRTVSNVVNDFPHVKASTRTKVKAAIEELGYRPNLSARQLKYGRGGFIALAVPNLEWPYFAELAAKVDRAAAALGYIMLLDVTRAEAKAERLVLAGMQTHMIDGVIFSPLNLTAEEIAARPTTVPMVLLGERSVPEGVDHVAVDSAASAQAMTQHLIGLGRTRLGAIGRGQGRGTGSVRLAGFEKALTEAGLPIVAERIAATTDYSREAGMEAMVRLLALSERPDAVFCFNDLMAIGALRACADAGVRVPGDIAIAGFDDSAESRFFSPSLTTISPDLDFLVAEVLRLLVARIEGSKAPTEQVRVGWELKVRESTIGTGRP